MNESATADEGGLPGLPPVTPKIRFRKVEAVGVSIIAAVVFLGAIGVIKPEESNGLDLVVRVAIIFIALTAGFRFIGKRELSQMSPFEIVTLLLIAEIVSPSLTAGDESIPGALIGAAMAPKLDFECWMQGLGLPLGDVMRATGPIMERRLSESGVSWTELDERQVIALFVSAFREAASAAFPQRDEEVLNEALDKMLANTQMEMLATSHGNNTLN